MEAKNMRTDNTTNNANSNKNDDNNNPTYYSFAIPASEPVADPRAAGQTKDAPGIEANTRCVLGDVTNSIRELDCRMHLKALLPPELASVTSDEVALSFVRSVVIATKFDADQRGQAFVAPPWAQQHYADLSREVREITAAATADLAREVRENAAATADLARENKEVAAVTTMTNLTLVGINIKLRNIETRYRNSLTKLNDETLTPMVNDAGESPNRFPKSRLAFHNLGNQEVEDLLQFYGLNIVSGELPAPRRLRLLEFVGIAA